MTNVTEGKRIDFYSPEQAAGRVGISGMLMRKLIRAGQGPRALALGSKTLRIRAADLEEWIERQTVER